MKTNMRFKGFNRVTPLTMGLIAGLIVAGLVGAFITKTLNLPGTASLVINRSAQQEKLNELEVKIYKIDGSPVETVKFGDVNVGEEVEISSFKIQNNGGVETRIFVLGDLVESEDGDNKIEKRVFDNESGLEYIYGVYLPSDVTRKEAIEKGIEEKFSNYPYLTTLEKEGGQKKIRLFLKFPNDQDTTEKSSTDVDFEYEFKLRKAI